jgi:hypothetical protein
VARVVGVPQLQARLHAVGGTGSSALMRQFGLRTVREAKLLVHRKTGNLGRSIRLASATPTQAVVIAGAHYAAYVELGTRPHTITPKVARVLAWGGARRLSGALRTGAKPTNFAMVVHHPGTKPYPYLIPGAKIAVQSGGAQVIVQAWDGAA